MLIYGTYRKARLRLSPTRREVCHDIPFKLDLSMGTDIASIDRQIPSVLSYIGGEEYHGTQAKAQLIRNSKNTVAYFRDYLGKE